jgi:hypothetical protein
LRFGVAAGFAFSEAGWAASIVAACPARDCSRFSIPSCRRIVAEPFGAAVELVAQQACDQQLQPRDLGLRLQQQVL